MVAPTESNNPEPQASACAAIGFPRSAALTALTLAIALSAAAQAQPRETTPDNVAALLESAALALIEERPADALADLERAESIEPHNPWVWYFRGSALRAIGDPYGAMEALDQAMVHVRSREGGDPALEERIRRDRAAARRDVFGVSLRIGTAYDSNVTFLGDVGSAPDIISGREDGRVSLGFSADFAPIAEPDQTFAIGVRSDQSWHFQIGEFDFQDYGGYLRYARCLSPRWRAELRYDYDFSLLGRDAFLSIHALTPSVTYDWPASEPQALASAAPRYQEPPAAGRIRLTETRLFFRAAWRDFRFDTDRASDRDGTARAVGLEQHWRWRPVAGSTWTTRWRAGYFYETIHTDGTQYDRRTHGLYAGVSAPLMNPKSPEKFLILPDRELRLALDAAWQRDDYRGGNLVDRDRSRRRDTGLSAGATLSQLLMSDPDHGELVLHLFVHWSDDNSNVKTREFATPFTYDKTVAGVQLQWSW